VLNVTVDNVYFSYDQKLILGGIDMRVLAGAFVCILGQSGCGKSTFLRLLAGLEQPTAGSILVDGRPVRKAGLDRGMVFQDYGLFPWMSAGENITIALKQKFKGLRKAERKAEALKKLREVELDESCFNKFPKELSGGMRQRCAIARAFAIDPPVLLMDEPFGALDAVTRARLQDLVLELWQKETKRRKTIFFVTHDVDEALLLATHIFVLGQSPGRIIYSHQFDGPKAVNRESMYADPNIVALRNSLIRIINEEILLKAGHQAGAAERNNGHGQTCR
jgi:NitT/TauT family transport system ATP-binding protein